MSNNAQNTATNEDHDPEPLEPSYPPTGAQLFEIIYGIKEGQRMPVEVGRREVNPSQWGRVNERVMLCDGRDITSMLGGEFPKFVLFGTPPDRRFFSGIQAGDTFEATAKAAKQAIDSDMDLLARLAREQAADRRRVLDALAAENRKMDATRALPGRRPWREAGIAMVIMGILAVVALGFLAFAMIETAGRWTR